MTPLDYGHWSGLSVSLYKGAVLESSNNLQGILWLERGKIDSGARMLLRARNGPQEESTNRTKCFSGAIGSFIIFSIPSLFPPFSPTFGNSNPPPASFRSVSTFYLGRSGYSASPNNDLRLVGIAPRSIFRFGPSIFRRLYPPVGISVALFGGLGVRRSFR